MTEIREILLRVKREESVRSISKTLGIHRKTINKYLSLCLELGVDPKEDAITDEFIGKVRARLAPGNKSSHIPRDDILLPHKDRIEAYLEKGIKGSKILILLKRDGIEVGDSSFYRFINTRCENYIRKNITVRLPETEPGKYLQADFGYMGLIWDEESGRMRKTHGLILTLCHSRHMYVYLTFAQDIRAVIEGFEAAWGYFGGITIIVIIDNLKPAIDKSCHYDPKINRQFLEYAQDRGFIVDPANSGHPKGKPIVEREVPYVRDNFFKGENFISIGDGRERAVDWCSNIAGLRIHGTTRKVPAQVFESVEKATLMPCPGERYDIPYWAVCKVHPDHHIRFKNSLYSLPTKYISKTMEVKGDSALVKIYFKGALVKIHKRMGPGKRSTDFDDYPKELAPYTLRNPKYQISEGYRRANEIGAFIEEILTGPYPWHRLRSAQKILRLSDRYGAGRMAKALTKAKAYSIFDMRRIENMLKNNVEDVPVEKEHQEQLKLDDPRFLRDSLSFNHYKQEKGRKMMEISKDLKEAMVSLRLSGITVTLAERISYARSKKLSYEEFLEIIFFDEKERRQARLLNSKMKKAGVDQDIKSYDWDTTTKYDRQIARKLFSLAFVESHSSVLAFGATGVGKTFLAKHLAFAALKAGYSVTFARTDKFFKHLRLSAIDGTYERTIRSYLKPDILVIDDFAVKEMTREEAGQFYEIILERYRKKSNIITSARSPEEWQALFPDPILGNSSLDRLAHSSYQILMDGPSLREQDRPK